MHGNFFGCITPSELLRQFRGEVVGMQTPEIPNARPEVLRRAGQTRSLTRPFGVPQDRRSRLLHRLVESIAHESQLIPRQFGINRQRDHLFASLLTDREIAGFVTQIDEAFLHMQRHRIVNL